MEKGAVALFAPQSSGHVPDISSAILETLLEKCDILSIFQMVKLRTQRRRDCPELRGQVGCGNTGVSGSWGPCLGTLLALTGDQLVQGLGSGTHSHPLWVLPTCCLMAPAGTQDDENKNTAY